MKEWNKLLSLDDALHPSLHFFDGQWAETEASATTLDSWCYFVHVVANDTESNILRVLLDNTT